MITIYRPTHFDAKEVNRTINIYGCFDVASESKDSLVRFTALKLSNMFPSRGSDKTVKQFAAFQEALDDGKLFPIEVDADKDNLFQVCQNMDKPFTENEEVKTDCEGLFTHSMMVGDIFKTSNGTFGIVCAEGFSRIF